MSDDDLRRVLSAAEASAIRVVEPPGVQAAHWTLRRRRRSRALLACLLAAGVISGSVAILMARADERPPPIDRVTPSAEPTTTTIPSGAAAPTAQPVVPPVAVTSTSSPMAPCTSNPMGVYIGDSGRIVVGAVDVTGRVLPICPGIRLRVLWASYRIDPGTPIARLYKTGAAYLDSTRSQVTLSPEAPPQTPTECSWWALIASNTVPAPNTVDLEFDLKDRTPQSPFWDQSRGLNALAGYSSPVQCSVPAGTPTP